MVQEVLFNLSLIIGIAAILSIIGRFIKQPPIIAYLIAGVLVGPFFFNFLGNVESEPIQLFARIGVAFLLFIVGLSLDFRLFREIGKVSTLAGILEIVMVGSLGFLIAIGFGFSNIAALYLGAVLAFSSTVVVVKILTDKKELNTLHGRIALGILIIQDIFASIFLMILPLINQQQTIFFYLRQFLIISFVIFAAFFTSTFLFRGLLNYLAKNQETLFLFGIAWALILSSIFNRFGFSIEIGALVAGMSLASSRYALDIGGKMKPLRDFFIVLFFIYFGSQLYGTITAELVKQTIIFSAFVMIGKPLIVMLSLKFFGYTKKTNFLTSISLAQISEFSLIIVMLGYNLGHLTKEIMNLAVLTALITIGLSTYAIHFSNSLSRKFLKFLGFIDSKRYKMDSIRESQYEIILFGYHRIGYKLLKVIKSITKRLLVIDYNPKVILSLEKEKIDTVYGDGGDKNLLEELPLKKAKIVISTIPDIETNITISEKLEEINSGAVFIATAEQPRTALTLYKDGVDYVIIPHHLGGDYLSHMIEHYKTNKEDYKKKGREHLKELSKAREDSNFY